MQEKITNTPDKKPISNEGIAKLIIVEAHEFINSSVRLRNLFILIYETEDKSIWEAELRNEFLRYLGSPLRHQVRMKIIRLALKIFPTDIFLKKIFEIGSRMEEVINEVNNFYQKKLAEEKIDQIMGTTSVGEKKTTAQLFYRDNIYKLLFGSELGWLISDFKDDRREFDDQVFLSDFRSIIQDDQLLFYSQALHTALENSFNLEKGSDLFTNIIQGFLWKINIIRDNISKKLPKSSV